MARIGTLAAATGTFAMIMATPGFLAAAEPDRAGERVLQSFAQCRAVTDPTQRLACFDKAAGALEEAVKNKEVRILDQEDVRRTKRSLFGFTLPQVGLFGDGEEEEKEEFTEINTTVTSARQVGNGRVEIRIASNPDAVWQTTETMTFPPKPGAKIRIRKGAIGSYFINVDGRSVRGMRVR